MEAADGGCRPNQPASGGRPPVAAATSMLCRLRHIAQLPPCLPCAQPATSWLCLIQNSPPAAAQTRLSLYLASSGASLRVSCVLSILPNINVGGRRVQTTACGVLWLLHTPFSAHFCVHHGYMCSDEGIPHNQGDRCNWDWSHHGH